MIVIHWLIDLLLMLAVIVIFSITVTLVLTSLIKALMFMIQLI